MSSNNQTSSNLELEIEPVPGMESYQGLSNTRRYSCDDPILHESSRVSSAQKRRIAQKESLGVSKSQSRGKMFRELSISEGLLSVMMKPGSKDALKIVWQPNNNESES